MQFTFKMKQIFICLFSLSAFYIFGQDTSPKIVSHVFHGTKTDSVRLTINIQKQDTLWVEKFNLNGLLASKTWKHDSLFTFDYKGRFIAKRFNFNNNPRNDDTSFFGKYHFVNQLLF